MPDLNVSSSDWDSVTPESQSAIAGIINNHFGMSVVASGWGSAERGYVGLPGRGRNAHARSGRRVVSRRG